MNYEFEQVESERMELRERRDLVEKVKFCFEFFQLDFSTFYKGYLLLVYPVLIFFMTWFWGVLQNTRSADFKSTMRLNQVSTICLNAFYVGIWVWGVFGGLS
ncbi:MAG: hypothetical protein ACJAWV_000406 [Flammeovirgaceae bacterium]|jgi:hypothetical protein